MTAGGRVGYDVVGPRVELEGMYRYNTGSPVVIFPTVRKQGTRQRRTAGKFQRAARHGGLKAAPVGFAQAFGHDDVDATAQSFRGLIAKEGGGSAIPELDLAAAIGVDHRVRHLVEYGFSRHRHALAHAQPSSFIAQPAFQILVMWRILSPSKLMQ